MGRYRVDNVKNVTKFFWDVRIIVSIKRERKN